MTKKFNQTTNKWISPREIDSFHFFEKPFVKDKKDRPSIIVRHRLKKSGNSHHYFILFPHLFHYNLSYIRALFIHALYKDSQEEIQKCLDHFTKANEYATFFTGFALFYNDLDESSSHMKLSLQTVHREENFSSLASNYLDPKKNHYSQHQFLHPISEKEMKQKGFEELFELLQHLLVYQIGMEPSRKPHDYDSFDDSSCQTLHHLMKKHVFNHNFTAFLNFIMQKLISNEKLAIRNAIKQICEKSTIRHQTISFFSEDLLNNRKYTRKISNQAKSNQKKNQFIGRTVVYVHQGMHVTLEKIIAAITPKVEEKDYSISNILRLPEKNQILSFDLDIYDGNSQVIPLTFRDYQSLIPIDLQEFKTAVPMDDRLTHLFKDKENYNQSAVFLDEISFYQPYYLGLLVNCPMSCTISSYLIHRLISIYQDRQEKHLTIPFLKSYLQSFLNQPFSSLLDNQSFHSLRTIHHCLYHSFLWLRAYYGLFCHQYITLPQLAHTIYLTHYYPKNLKNTQYDINKQAIYTHLDEAIFLIDKEMRALVNKQQKVEETITQLSILQEGKDINSKTEKQREKDIKTLAKQKHKNTSKYSDLSLQFSLAKKTKAIKEAFYPGHVEIYKTKVDKGYHYDYNSLYPYVMKTFDMPVGNPTTWNGEPLKDCFGFLLVQINCPSNPLFKPVLPVKLDNEYIVYPTGQWKGWYFSEELKDAQSLGYDIKILDGYLYQRLSGKKLFSPFIKTFNEVKYHSYEKLSLITAQDTNLRYKVDNVSSFSPAIRQSLAYISFIRKKLSKLMMNSVFGKISEHDPRYTSYLYSHSFLMDDIYPSLSRGDSLGRTSITESPIPLGMKEEVIYDHSEELLKKVVPNPSTPFHPKHNHAFFREPAFFQDTEKPVATRKIDDQWSIITTCSSYHNQSKDTYGLPQLTMPLKRKNGANLEIGAAITAYARIVLHQFIKPDFPVEVAYIDTDCIVTTQPLPSQFLCNHTIGKMKNVVATERKKHLQPISPDDKENFFTQGIFLSTRCYTYQSSFHKSLPFYHATSQWGPTNQEISKDLHHHMHKIHHFISDQINSPNTRKFQGYFMDLLRTTVLERRELYFHHHHKIAALRTTKITLGFATYLAYQEVMNLFLLSKPKNNNSQHVPLITINKETPINRSRRYSLYHLKPEDKLKHYTMAYHFHSQG